MSSILRSKDCISCRVKRRRCNQRLPHCSSCTRSGDGCVYPAAKLTICSTNSSSDRRDSLHRLIAPGALRAPNAPHDRSLLRTSSEIKLQEQFWRIYLPDQIGPHSSGRSDLSRHLAYIIDSACGGGSTRTMLNACALTCLGGLHHRVDMLHCGMRLYIRALSMVRHALQTPPCSSDVHNLIASCRLLALYEMIRPFARLLPSQGKDWRRHAEATCRLVESLKAHERSSASVPGIYLDVRLLALRINIVGRKPLFLSDSLWQAFASDRLAHDLASEVYELMARIPDMLRESDRLLRGMVSLKGSAKLVQMLRHELLDAAERFRTFEHKCLATFLSGGEKAKPRRPGLTVPDILITRNQGYECLLILNQCWASYLLVCAQARHLVSRCTSHFPPIAHMQPSCTHQKSCSLNIVASIPHLLSRSAGLWIAEQSAFPIATVLHYLTAFEPSSHGQLAVLQSFLREPRFKGVSYAFIQSVTIDSTVIESGGDLSLPHVHRRLVNQWFG